MEKTEGSSVKDYVEYLKKKEEEFESLCNRCGQCCGAYDGDPCAKLVYNKKNGKYYCSDYSGRLGLQVTVSGKEFTCVPILDNIRAGGIYPGCPYNFKYAK